MVIKILYLISALFELEEEYPVIMLIKKGQNDSHTYNGPKEIDSLIEFVRSETGRGPRDEKVGYNFIVEYNSNLQSIIYRNAFWKGNV